jgi:hypothetical protein
MKRARFAGPTRSRFRAGYCGLACEHCVAVELRASTVARLARRRRKESPRRPLGDTTRLWIIPA